MNENIHKLPPQLIKKNKIFTYVEENILKFLVFHALCCHCVGVVRQESTMCTTQKYERNHLMHAGVRSVNCPLYLNCFNLTVHTAIVSPLNYIQKLQHGKCCKFSGILHNSWPWLHCCRQEVCKIVLDSCYNWRIHWSWRHHLPVISILV